VNPRGIFESSNDMLLIVGSSPMVEVIPALLGASTKRPALLAIGPGVFAVATIATEAATCMVGLRSLQRACFGPLERYAEILSGLFVAAVGVDALFTS